MKAWCLSLYGAHVRTYIMNCSAGAQAEYEARVQLLEIYNEQLRDLLDEQRSGRRLDIRNTERSGLNVPDAIQAGDRDCWQKRFLKSAMLPSAWSSFDATLCQKQCCSSSALDGQRRTCLVVPCKGHAEGGRST